MAGNIRTIIAKKNYLLLDIFIMLIQITNILNELYKRTETVKNAFEEQKWMCGLYIFFKSHNNSNFFKKGAFEENELM